MPPPFLSQQQWTNGFGLAPPPSTPNIFGMNLGAPSGPMEGMLQSVVPMFAEMLRKEFGGQAFTFGSD